MFKLRRLILALLFSLLVYFGFVTFEVFKIIHDVRLLPKNGDVSMSILYRIFDFGFDQSVAMSSLKFLILVGVSTFLFTYIKNTSVFINLQQRLGYRKFLIKSCIHIFSISTVLACITELYQILLVSVFESPILFSKSSQFLLVEKRVFFTQNSLINIILFVLTSSVGWGIFSLFIFAINLFIKKDIICIINSVIVGTVLIMLPGMINLAFGNNVYISRVLFVIFAPSLLAPGQMSFGAQLPPIKIGYAFIISSIIYILISIVIINYWIKRKKKLG